MPDDYLDELEPSQRADMWRGRIEREDLPPVLVVTIDNEVAGFAAYGAPVADGEPIGCGQLYAINLDPTHWRRGAGRRLLRAATDALQALGYDEAILWVVPQNERARRLYESEGWSADGGAMTDDALGATVDEIRYRRQFTE
jgi:ribosomal protein S18 acetylase RimI-like enzyme